MWVRNGGYLLFSNMPEGVIAKWTPDGDFASVDLTKFIDHRNCRFRELLSNGLTFDREGRLVYCSQNRTRRHADRKRRAHTIRPYLQLQTA